MHKHNIAIVSIADDLHALVIQKALSLYANIRCHIVESNRMAGTGQLAWSVSDRSAKRTYLPVRGGTRVAVETLDVIWWRRVGYPQKLPSSLTDAAHIEVINNSSRAALLGMLLNEFHGTWINHPFRNQYAENKLIQLDAARRAGFRVPRTLVSQDPATIRRFCKALSYKVVLKPIATTHRAPLFTRRLNSKDLRNDEALSYCPAIYQEYIEGNRHIRVHCFGEAILAAAIDSAELDWRQRRDLVVSAIQLPKQLERRLRGILQALHLKMGVVDLKLTSEGDFVWFEINPQGQFLFIEGLMGMELSREFAAFLHREASSANKGRQE